MPIPPSPESPPTRIDVASVGGLILSVGGIVGGLLLEGGDIADISQMTAALIVLVGTAGAVMVTTPPAVLWGALKKLRIVFFEQRFAGRELIVEILEYSGRARRNGIVSLESELGNIHHPFLRKALRLGVDGTDLQEIRSTMELELDTEERTGRAHAKVYESAGGYAPTIGIIGAVLGLIQVMKHLEDISMVGHGIAVAFVATVYGVAIANLFFLPVAGKLKARLDLSIRSKELMLEGVAGIMQGMHPDMIEQKLESFLPESTLERKSEPSTRNIRVRAA